MTSVDYQERPIPIQGGLRASAFRERSVLLPADAEKLSEPCLLSESDPAALQSDVLKVSHHGSKDSTIPDFLAAVQPRLIIVSSGEGNSYGHPSPELNELLC